MFKKKSNLLQDNKRKLITNTNSKSPISEQYRTIRTNIQFAAVDQEMQVIMVTSSTPGEGKSTTAANLAVVMAQQAKKVLFIDADLRKPTAHYTFNQSNTFGLTNVLMKKVELTDAVKATDIDNLYILTSGPVPPNPAELLGSKMMKDLLKQIRMEFDTVIIDTPPLLAVTDAQIMANICDGTVLVISSGKAEIENVKKVKDMLQATSSTLLGAVINNKEITGDSGYYYYYGN